MSIVDIKNVLETSSLRIAILVFASSVIFLLPDSWVSYILSFLFFVIFLLPDSWVFWVLDLRPGLEHYHAMTQETYGLQIFIALIVSLVLLLSHLCYWAWERWKNRKGRLRIIKATYGTDKFHTIDVTARIKKRKEKKDGEDYLKFLVDDGVLLAIGKKDDPTPGSDKTFWFEYWYKHTEKYEKGEPVEISEERWQPERDRPKIPAA